MRDDLCGRIKRMGNGWYSYQVLEVSPCRASDVISCYANQVDPVFGVVGGRRRWRKVQQHFEWLCTVIALSKTAWESRRNESALCFPWSVAFVCLPYHVL